MSIADFSKNYNRFLRQVLFLSLLIALGGLVVVKLDFFIGGVLGAVSMYVVLRPLLFQMTERWGWHPIACALLLALITMLLVGGAVWGIGRVLGSDMPATDPTHLLERARGYVDHWAVRFGVRLAPDEVLRETGGSMARAFSSLLSMTSGFAVNLLLLPVVLYFMLVGGRQMERTIEHYLPFRGVALASIKKEVKGIIYSNMIGIPMVMFFQGLVSLPVYALLGVKHVVFWSFLTAVCGMLPVVGTAVVTVPMGLYLFLEVSPWRGVIMWACAVLVIANADNLCRIYLMRRLVHSHPLAVVFGLFLGVPLFGFWGIVFGPLMISGLLLLVRIYYREYHLLTPDREHETVASTLTNADEGVERAGPCDER